MPRNPKRIPTEEELVDALIKPKRKKKLNPNEGAILHTPESIKQVNDLLYVRENILDRLKCVTFARKDGGGLGLTFNGTYQGEELLELIRHPLRAHFLHHLTVNENQLKVLGVIVEPKIEEQFPTPAEWEQALSGGELKDEA